MVYEKDENAKVIETKNDFALRAAEYAHKKSIKPKRAVNIKGGISFYECRYL